MTFGPPCTRLWSRRKIALSFVLFIDLVALALAFEALGMALKEPPQPKEEMMDYAELGLKEIVLATGIEMLAQNYTSYFWL